MDQDLRDLFGKAVADEPVPLGDITRDAMTDGTRIRRRRRLLTGSAAALALVAVLGTVTAVNSFSAPPVQPAAPPPALLPLAMAGGLDCQPGDEGRATQAAIFLDALITEPERAALDAQLSADGLVMTFEYETREAAYRKFRDLWTTSAPNMIDQVTPDQLPESFRVVLRDENTWRTFADAYKDERGVDEVVGTICTGPA